jgi:hypothetical protein
LACQVSSRAAPPALGVDAAAEGVHHGVEVGADLEPVHPDVVGGVGDHRDLGVSVASSRSALSEFVAQRLVVAAV